jgi:hypothetical protein
MGAGNLGDRDAPSRPGGHTRLRRGANWERIRGVNLPETRCAETAHRVEVTHQEFGCGWLLYRVAIA